MSSSRCTIDPQYNTINLMGIQYNLDEVICRDPIVNLILDQVFEVPSVVIPIVLVSKIGPRIGRMINNCVCCAEAYDWSS